MNFENYAPGDHKQSRLMQFNSKLESLSQTLTNERRQTTHRYEQLNSELNDKYHDLERLRNERIAFLEDNLAQLKEAIPSSPEEHKDDGNATADVDATLRLNLSSLVKERESSEARLISALQSRLDAVVREFEQDSTQAENMRSQRENAATTDVSRLQEELNEVIELGQEADEELEQAIDVELKKLRSNLEADRIKGQNVHQNLMDKFETVTDKLNGLLADEAKARQEGEAILIDLLEATCFKVNEARSL
ncbi:Chromosome partition protein Smc [Carpediemonas membranifera]|uniref:Chromosome partition protein Smc n=1 Tax=Carpediemonas membranifera TaxID=201153 RepID=A0A8J6AXR4_9EUKA|nr:Chromosome partition protein Smc [Carpediemonas membranifera]|eukprot:KAG9394110.1 Chromosome partition protein Smc [Carpediemonas membranifera]